MTQALKSRGGPYQPSNGPRSSHHLARRDSGSRSGSLRGRKRLSWTNEEGSNHPVAVDHSDRHLRSGNDGAGTRGPSRGSTCRGGACSVPCTRADSGSDDHTIARALRERAAGAGTGDLRSAFLVFVRCAYPREEADADLPTEDRAREERRIQEGPREAEEALSELRKSERGFLNPHSASFDY